MKCIKCQHEISNNDSFCSECGASQEIGKKEAWDQALKKADGQIGGRTLLYIDLQLEPRK